MEITSKTDASFQIKGKSVTLVINVDRLMVPERPELIIDGPGEYEVGGATIEAKRIDETLCFKIILDNLSLLYLPKAPQSVETLEEFSPVDILFLGEYGESIHELEAKVIIPFSNEISTSLGKTANVSKKLSLIKEKLPESLEVVILHG